MKRAVIYGACLAIVLAAPLAASAEMASSDARFMKNVAQDGKAEVELGKLAAERGGSDSVKQFGSRMATDHAKAGEELAKLAQHKGVTLPSDVDRKHKRLHDTLSKLTGADFDREYMKAMTSDHDADVKAFQREAKSAKDADLRAWASKILPTLEEHEQQAHELHASVGGKGKRSEGSASPGGKY
jgi:putative membrane protein